MPVELSYLQAVVLGIVEGLTEFLPISSTGHLTIAEHLLGLPVNDRAVTAYTAIIQIGAIVATFIFFAKKIARLFLAWVRGLTSAPAREDRDYGLAWAVVSVAQGQELGYFFLGCVLVAGLVGGASVKPTIYVLQALPAAIALLLLYLKI